MSTKKVAGPDDLAINGAPPAFSKPLHVGRPNLGNRARFYELLNESLDRYWLTNNGPLVQEFERRVAALLGVKHCVAVVNGTVGLEIAIRALGLSKEVIVPSYTFIASVHCLHWLGLTPVFADIDSRTHTLDPNAVRRAITSRTSAILAVHLWGRAAPIDALQTIADEHGLTLLFDAAQAFGCSYRNRRIGNFGACEVFSFHATKFFNTIEGGAITTNDEVLADKLRRMRNFGFSGPDAVASIGTNGKMTEAAAAMGISNLESLDHFLAVNRRNIDAYRRGLAGIPGIFLMQDDVENEGNQHYVVIECGEDCPVSRDTILAALRAENVLARRYFWPGCHRMEPYCTVYTDAETQLPNTRLVAARVIALPTGTAVGKDEIETICAIIRTAACQNSHGSAVPKELGTRAVS
jgi:dTDP-4-amino-4,6-dideoxygalactose transaminase